MKPSDAEPEINVRETCSTRAARSSITLRSPALKWRRRPAPTRRRLPIRSGWWARIGPAGGLWKTIAFMTRNVGRISLGKEISTGDNESTRTHRKSGYQYQKEAVYKALHAGWEKGVVGGHVVRGNVIYDCGQNGVVGHMGCAFSLIEGNHIHRIGTKREFFGWEVARH